MYKNVEIIAEVKTQSPFGFTSPYPWGKLFEIALTVGDIISIHTDPRWGGSMELIDRARSLTNKPILAKGIHATDDHIEEAIRHGATYVLVVGRMPGSFLDRCFLEPLTLQELKNVPSTHKAVWNSRDLSDGSLKTETFEEARKVFPGWLCQASNIRTVADIQPAANAVLVGSALPEFAASLS
jgi:indole-3-glycerol phosphate synthase